MCTLYSLLNERIHVQEEYSIVEFTTPLASVHVVQLYDALSCQISSSYLQTRATKMLQSSYYIINTTEIVTKLIASPCKPKEAS